MLRDCKSSLRKFDCFLPLKKNQSAHFINYSFLSIAYRISNEQKRIGNRSRGGHYV